MNTLRKLFGRFSENQWQQKKLANVSFNLENTLISKFYNDQRDSSPQNCANKSIFMFKY